MPTELSDSPFSRHFNMLLCLGAWIYETNNPMKENLFVVYKLFMTLLALYGCYMLICDFYNSIGDLKSMAWNLCVSVMFIASLIKAFQLLQRNHTINTLRKSLHRDAESRKCSQHIYINNLALKELKLLQASFYGTAVIFIPIWLFMKYFAKSRELPVPFCLPFDFDKDDDEEYTVVFILVATGGVVGIWFAVESELATFCILIQISREYRILLSDIPQLNAMYEDSNPKNKNEVNPRLRRLKAQTMIKQISARQKELIEIGGWIYETNDPNKLNMFVVYRLFMTCLAIGGCFMLLFDFYFAFGNLKSMVWNLCVSVLYMGSLLKILQLMMWNQTINGLRWSLHRDGETKKAPEHININNLALKELKMLQASYYCTAAVFIPIWLFVKYFAQQRELPVPLFLPFNYNLDDDEEYIMVFVLVAAGGIIGIVFCMESELSTFSILIQITREYRILLSDIPKLNFMYEDIGWQKKTEVNPNLRRLKAQYMIKQFLAKQNNLIEYTKIFELCYNQCFLQQMFGISILILTLSVQCMLGSFDVFGNLLYQMGYLSIVVVDMFLLCWFSTRLETFCYEVGEAAYSTLWYKMETETRKDLAMLILRSQHPPKITTGKLMELSLNAFIHRMSNIYSWLALFRTLEFKGT